MADQPTVHLLWINAGLSCDGDSVALTAATQPSVEGIVLGALQGLPKVDVHWPTIDYHTGGPFIEWFWKGIRGLGSKISATHSLHVATSAETSARRSPRASLGSIRKPSSPVAAISSREIRSIRASVGARAARSPTNASR